MLALSITFQFENVMTESESLSIKWKAIGEKFGIAVEAPYQEYTDDFQIEASALLPDFGGPRGMLIFYSFEKIKEIHRRLTKNGFGYSVLSAPEDPSEIDEEAVIEMLRDWGWYSISELKPGWL